MDFEYGMYIIIIIFLLITELLQAIAAKTWIILVPTAHKILAF